MLIPEIDLNSYLYDLPDNYIAQVPNDFREKSKLLFTNTNEKNIKHLHFFDIIDLVNQNSLIVLNESKVIPARIRFNKLSGGKAEILCINPIEPSIDPQLVLASKKSCKWHCIIGGKKINIGQRFDFEIDYNNEKIILNANIIDRKDNTAIIEFSWKPDNFTFAEVLNSVGSIPLPPYIKRKPVELDKITYQTVYASCDGSVAAPTAGLHFSDDIINKLKQKGIDFAKVILHIGPGTFVPITADNIIEHEMHTEMVSITKQTIFQVYKALQNGQKIIATGTTSVRALESLFWLGFYIKEHRGVDCNNLCVEQWLPYQYSFDNNQATKLEILDIIINYMEMNKISTISFNTKLFIVPGYVFQIVQGLITNFHLPGSTLILLVAAFIGDSFWKEIYSEAILNNYRFLSYGDSSFIIK